jgi:hypothetical protein
MLRYNKTQMKVTKWCSTFYLCLGRQRIKIISRQSVYQNDKIFCSKHWPPLPPRKYSWYSLSRRQRTTGRSMSTTPSGIELSTFRLTVQCLNQLQHTVPTGVFYVYTKFVFTAQPLVEVGIRLVLRTHISFTFLYIYITVLLPSHCRLHSRVREIPTRMMIPQKTEWSPGAYTHKKKS